MYVVYIFNTYLRKIDNYSTKDQIEKWKYIEIRFFTVYMKWYNYSKLDCDKLKRILNYRMPIKNIKPREG